jgi:hypothetical protein
MEGPVISESFHSVFELRSLEIACKHISDT